MNVRRFLQERASGQVGERPLLMRVALVLALLFLVFQFGGVLLQYSQVAATALRYPYPLDYVEGPALDQVMSLASGERIYRSDLTQPPYTVTHNAPLFLLLQAPFGALAGPAYWYGRLLALLGGLLSALFVGLILYRLTRDVLSSTAGGLLLLAFPYLLHGSLIDQPDSLALALSLAGLWLVLRSAPRAQNRAGQASGVLLVPRRALVSAAALFVLAIFTQPAYFLAGPLAAAAWLAQTRRARQALALVGMLLGGSLVLFVLLNLLTGGGFYYNLVTANPALFSFKTVVAHSVRLLTNLFYLLIGTLIFLSLERVGDYTETWPLVLPYFVGALVAAVFSGFANASERAFFELAACFALAAGAILSWVKSNGWLRASIVLLLALQVGQMLEWSGADYAPRITDRLYIQDDVAGMLRVVRASKQPVLADEYNGLLPLAGKRIFFEPLEFKALSEAGLWDANHLIARINAKEFSNILFHIPMDAGQSLSMRWYQPIRNAIWTNYHYVETKSQIYRYEPKP